MRVIKLVAKVVGFIIGASVFLAACNAYFIIKFNPANKALYDGFGRQLSESPFFIRMVFGQERLWAGWSWFIIDLVIFWSGIAVAWFLIGFGLKNNKVK